MAPVFAANVRALRRAPVFVVRGVMQRFPRRHLCERVSSGAAGSEASFKVTFSVVGYDHTEDLVSFDAAAVLALGRAG